MKRKVCTHCKVKKAVNEFSKQSYPNQKYLRPHCIVCGNAYRRLLRKRNPKFFRDCELRSLYGISLSEWKLLFKKQNRQCAICKRKRPTIRKRWFTDHSHKTNRVRGILCGHCNAMLGYARDVIEVLLAAVEYLRRHKQ